jgi:hypothetical protein
MPDAVCVLLLITVFFQLATNSRIFQPSLYHIVSYKHDRDTEQSNRNRASLPGFHSSSEDHTTCIFPGVKRPERRADLLKYNGGEAGIKIPVLYWRCPLIRASVIRGSTVYHKKYFRGTILGIAYKTRSSIKQILNQKPIQNAIINFYIVVFTNCLVVTVVRSMRVRPAEISK